MVRRYEEPIEVRSGVGVAGVGVAGVGVAGVGVVDAAPDPAPSAFLWRGRLYIVRVVIGHWRERRAWWREALDSEEEDSDTGRRRFTVPGLDCLEQEVWRVEASTGRLAGTGVYDLGRNDLGRDDLDRDRSERSWRLLRVAD